VGISFSVLHDGQPVSSNHCGSEDCFFFSFFHLKINFQKLPRNENRICVIFNFSWGRPKTKSQIPLKCTKGFFF
jgi:hypothetical protein